jgi:hypothetical protein
VGTGRRNTVTVAVREQEAPVGSSIAITRADDRPVVPVTPIKVRPDHPPAFRLCLVSAGRAHPWLLAAVKFALDSLLEERVSSEPVSEVRAWTTARFREVYG